MGDPGRAGCQGRIEETNMALRQAWVFWCDAVEVNGTHCDHKIFGYAMKQVEAVIEAKKRDWYVWKYANRYYCYCPEHKNYRMETTNDLPRSD